MKGYPQRFCNINEKDAKTKLDLREGGMSMWSQNRLKCLYHDVKSKQAWVPIPRSEVKKVCFLKFGLTSLIVDITGAADSLF
jgi:hypothetical protein